MTKLLLVEDEKNFADAVCQWLEGDGFMVDCAHSGPEALAHLKGGDYALVVLDVNLPGLSGIDVLRTFRSHGGRTPVLMLTGNRTIDDKELGFDAGADDYLTKPFQMRELSMRVRALLRRAAPATQEEVLQVGDITLHRSEHIVTVSDVEVSLLPREFDLLLFFMENPGTVFSADAIVQRVWPSSSETTADTIRSYITRLRQKLGADKENQIIATVHGVGYKLLPTSCS